ncbi:unnamed protein product [Alternaria sp. RS040]
MQRNGMQQNGMQQNRATVGLYHFIQHYRYQQQLGKIPDGWQQDTPPEERGGLAFQHFTQNRLLKPEMGEIESMRTSLQFETSFFTSSIAKDTYISSIQEQLTMMIKAQQRQLQQRIQQSVQQQSPLLSHSQAQLQAQRQAQHSSPYLHHQDSFDDDQPSPLHLARNDPQLFHDPVLRFDRFNLKGSTAHISAGSSPYISLALREQTRQVLPPFQPDTFEAQQQAQQQTQQQAYSQLQAQHRAYLQLQAQNRTREWQQERQRAQQAKLTVPLELNGVGALSPYNPDMSGRSNQSVSELHSFLSGHAEMMSPPEINIDFEPPSRLTSPDRYPYEPSIVAQSVSQSDKTDIRPVPKFDRTYTDIAVDNFYEPSAVIQSVSQSKPTQSSLLSPYRSNANENV